MVRDVDKRLRWMISGFVNLYVKASTSEERCELRYKLQDEILALKEQEKPKCKTCGGSKLQPVIMDEDVDTRECPDCKDLLSELVVVRECENLDTEPDSPACNLQNGCDNEHCDSEGTITRPATQVDLVWVVRQLWNKQLVVYAEDGGTLEAK